MNHTISFSVVDSHAVAGRTDGFDYIITHALPIAWDWLTRRSSSIRCAKNRRRLIQAVDFRHSSMTRRTDLGSQWTPNGRRQTPNWGSGCTLFVRSNRIATRESRRMVSETVRGMRVTNTAWTGLEKVGSVVRDSELPHSQSKAQPLIGRSVACLVTLPRGRRSKIFRLV